MTGPSRFFLSAAAPLRPAHSGRAMLLLPVLAALVALSCARMVPEPQPPVERPVWRTLAHNENESELNAFLDRYPPGSERREAARFLADNLPPADAASMSAAELAETVDYAFRARERFPWAAPVPWDVFLRWVLPHRSAQEPAQRCRALLFRELAPRMAPAARQGAAGVTRAALELALWCQEKLQYVATQRRDAGPLTVLLRGRARCEEASILYCAAARSVGIPARVAMTPAWQFADDNHAWVEVYLQGRWHYLDPANPSPALDRAWFSDNAANALLVVTTAYGSAPPDNRIPGGGIDHIMSSGPGYMRLNLTGRYTREHELRVTVLDQHGKPLPHARVGVSIYNYAGFTPAAVVDCDATGHGVLRLGKGSVLLTVEHDGRRDFTVVRVSPDGAAATLDIRRNRTPEGTLRFPFGQRLAASGAAAAFAGAAPSDGAQKIFKDRKSAAGELRTQRFAALHDLASQRLDALALPFEDGGEIRDQLRNILQDAGANASNLLDFMESLPAGQRRLGAAMLLGLWAADTAVPADPQAWRSEFAAVIQAQEHATRSLALSLDAATWSRIWPFLACHRITRYEPHSLYFAQLGQRFRNLAQHNATRTAANVARYTSSLSLVRSHPLGPVCTPLQAVRLGAVTGEMERAIVYVGILRSLGIPARHYEQWNLTEFHDGKQWRPAFPNHPEWTGNPTADPHAEALYAPAAQLKMRVVLNGAPAKEQNVNYFRDCSLSVFKSRRAGDPPFFRRLDPDDRFLGIVPKAGQETPNTPDGQIIWNMPAGNYMFIYGHRNRQGEPTVHVGGIPMEPGALHSGTVDLTSGP